jgi:hypothetical protein
MVNVHQDMVKVYVDTLNVSLDAVYMPMYMVNVPHDMLKGYVGRVNVPQGMVKVSMDTCMMSYAMCSMFMDAFITWYNSQYT